MIYIFFQFFLPPVSYKIILAAHFLHGWLCSEHLTSSDRNLYSSPLIISLWTSYVILENLLHTHFHSYLGSVPLLQFLVHLIGFHLIRAPYMSTFLVVQGYHKDIFSALRQLSVFIYQFLQCWGFWPQPYHWPMLSDMSMPLVSCEISWHDYWVMLPVLLAWLSLN